MCRDPPRPGNGSKASRTFGCAQPMTLLSKLVHVAWQCSRAPPNVLGYLVSSKQISFAVVAHISPCSASPYNWPIVVIGSLEPDSGRTSLLGRRLLNTDRGFRPNPFRMPSLPTA